MLPALRSAHAPREEGEPQGAREGRHADTDSHNHPRTDLQKWVTCKFCKRPWPRDAAASRTLLAAGAFRSWVDYSSWIAEVRAREKGDWEPPQEVVAEANTAELKAGDDLVPAEDDDGEGGHPLQCAFAATAARPAHRTSALTPCTQSDERSAATAAPCSNGASPRAFVHEAM